MRWLGPRLGVSLFHVFLCEMDAMCHNLFLEGVPTVHYAAPLHQSDQPSSEASEPKAAKDMTGWHDAWLLLVARDVFV